MRTKPNKNLGDPQSSYLAIGTWCLAPAPDTWYLAPGTWCLALGTWYLLPSGAPVVFAAIRMNLAPPSKTLEH
jgi:hypothetical protein